MGGGWLWFSEQILEKAGKEGQSCILGGCSFLSEQQDMISLSSYSLAPLWSPDITGFFASLIKLDITVYFHLMPYNGKS